jgi:UDP-glucuronate 4-epimerase
MGEVGSRTVIHLAAQAGVRHSIDRPAEYVQANLVGFANVLEGCRRSDCRHLVYASTSSVYGANTRLPFKASEGADHPVSFYAATKRANEAMAHSYAHLFGLPCTGLRFFTVYGPWGRPDMAMSLFANAILAGTEFKLFDAGQVRRDYTFVDDVAEAVLRVAAQPPAGNAEWTGDEPDSSSSLAPWRILNVGSGRPVAMSDIVQLLEQSLGRQALWTTRPLPAGDMPATFADVEPLETLTGYRPADAAGRGHRPLRGMVSGLAKAGSTGRPQLTQSRERSTARRHPATIRSRSASSIEGRQRWPAFRKLRSSSWSDQNPTASPAA